ncbi:MAG: hypothetical protein HYT09_00840, partial [Candidatus Levybacteria bacterium]|nr:hypothetical protein [Candidatus Levybacteria bacterium]
NEEIKELIEKYFLLPARVDGFLWEGYDGFTVGHASFSNSNVTVGGFNDGLLFIFAEMLPPTTEETPDFNGTNPPVGPIQT